MPAYPPHHAITTIADLEALFAPPAPPSIAKEAAYIHPHYATLIAASPFAVLATNGPDGLDVSPRGDAPGFVVVEDDTTLLLPERRGNNRIDSLRNLSSIRASRCCFSFPGTAKRCAFRAARASSPSPHCWSGSPSTAIRQNACW